jgi:hypothetical protein
MADDQDLDAVLDALLDALDDVERPVATSVEVADRLGVSRPTATDRLFSLAARGDADTDKVGRTRIWWASDPDFSPAKSPTQTPANTSTQTPANTQTSAKTTGKTDPEADDQDDDGRDDQAVEQVDVPGQAPDLVERRRDAVRLALDYLDDQGEADAEAIREAVFETETGDYANPASLWKNCLSPAFAELRERDVVVLKKPSRGIYSLA